MIMSRFMRADPTGAFLNLPKGTSRIFRRLVKDLEPSSTVLARPAHRDGSTTDQRLRVGIAAPGQSDPHARREVYLRLLQLERKRKRSRQALSDRDRIGLALDLLAEHRELAVPDAGSAVTRAYDGHQPVGHLAQRFVGSRPAGALRDPGPAVEVQQQHR